MNNFNKKYIISLLLLVSVVGVSAFAFVSPALAGDANVTLRNPLCVTGATGNACVDSFTILITKILTFVTEVVGALAVLMLVVAGIFFVLAGANPENVNKAKQIALYAIIGLAIALAGRGLMTVVTAIISP